MVQTHGEEMKPSLLMRTLIESLDGWFFAVLLVIAAVFGVIVYSHRIVGIKPAVLYAVIFAFVVTYASGGAIVLFLLAWGGLCIGGYHHRQGFKRTEETSKSDGDFPELVKAGMLLPFAMAGMILFPILNQIMDTGVFFLFIPFVLWGIRGARGGFKNIAQYISWDEVVWLGLFLLFAVAAFLRLAGVWSAEDYRAGNYVAVASAVLLHPLLKSFAGWDRGFLRIPVVIGIWVLALYFVDTALLSGNLLLFDKGQDTLNYINMTAYLVILMASGLYIYAEDRAMCPVYIAGVVVPALAIAVNEAWGTAFLFFAMLVVHSVTILPVAGIMKRLSRLFFGAALFFCSVPLWVNYSGLIHVEGLEYHLECGLTGALFLCPLIIYVFKRWTKLPSGIDLWEIKLTRLQEGCRCFLIMSLALLVPVALLSLVDGRLREADLEINNLVQLFVGEKWEKINSGVLVIILLSLLEHKYEALMQMWRGNIFAAFYQMYGFLGVAAVLADAVLLCRRLYRGKRTADDLAIWLAMGSLSALLCLPVTIYMLPAYLMPVLMAVHVGETGKAGK